MKRASLFILGLGIVLGTLPRSAAAQAPPLTRADMTVRAGWLNTNKSELTGLSRNDWVNRALLGGAAVGWYWTDHHKTEVEVAASSRSHLYAPVSFTAGGADTITSSQFTFSSRRLTLAEQYQFYRNVLFHPYVAAGADLMWETTTQRVDSIRVFPSGGTSREIRPEQLIGPDTRLRVRPFAEAGFKAYMTRRAFFRADARALGRQRLDEVQFRAGFGLDF